MPCWQSTRSKFTEHVDISSKAALNSSKLGRAQSEIGRPGRNAIHLFFPLFTLLSPFLPFIYLLSSLRPLSTLSFAANKNKFLSLQFRTPITNSRPTFDCRRQSIGWNPPSRIRKLGRICCPAPFLIPPPPKQQF